MTAFVGKCANFGQTVCENAGGNIDRAVIALFAVRTIV